MFTLLFLLILVADGYVMNPAAGSGREKTRCRSCGVEIKETKRSCHKHEREFPPSLQRLALPVSCADRCCPAAAASTEQATLDVLQLGTATSPRATTAPWRSSPPSKASLTPTSRVQLLHLRLQLEVLVLQAGRRRRDRGRAHPLRLHDRAAWSQEGLVEELNFDNIPNYQVYRLTTFSDLRLRPGEEVFRSLHLGHRGHHLQHQVRGASADVTGWELLWNEKYADKDPDVRQLPGRLRHCRVPAGVRA